MFHVSRRLLAVLGPLSLLLGAPSSHASSGAFVMTALTDTIAIERYESSAGKLEGALLFRLGRLRFDYRMDLAGDGSVTRMTNHVRPASAPLASPPTQSATLVWRGDSVEVDVQPGKPQRLGTTPGSIPYLNPSLAMIEWIVKRAHDATPRMTSVPVLGVGNGRTFEMQVAFPGADSAIASIGSVEFRLRIDREGRILSGAVPTQSVVFTRVEALPEGLLTLAPID